MSAHRTPSFEPDLLETGASAPAAGARSAGRGGSVWIRRPIARSAREALAAVSLAILLGGALVTIIAAADGSTLLVPAGHERFPAWLAGPLSGLGQSLPVAPLVALLATMWIAYVLMLAVVDAIPGRTALGAVVAAHVLFLLGPPILSSDVFGYLAYARLGVEHGLDPFTHAVEEIPGDPVTTYLSSVWPTDLSTPYGPLFLLATYVLVPLGIPGALWALKIATALAALVTVAIVGACARRLGHSPKRAMLFVGLNPLWLAWAVGGAHNDLLMILPAMAGVLLLAGARRPGLGGAALGTAVAIKATAGLVLVFALVGTKRRLRTVAGAALAGAAVAAAGLAVFGTDLLHYPANLLAQGEHLSRHNVPERTARLLGFETLTPELQRLVTAVFGVTVVGLLVRVARGGDWITAVGWATVGFLLSTTSLHTWYIVALLPFAALGSSRALRLTTLAVCLLLVYVQLTF